MWQALHVQALLKKQYPVATVEVLGMTTRGDQILDRTLSKVGGKGLFVKELEAAMMEGRADLAVHSLKDVPMELPEGFALPNKRFAHALPPLCPGRYMLSMALTLSAKGSSTGEPPKSTTATFLPALTNASIKSSWFCGRRISSRSQPSLST